MKEQEGVDATEELTIEKEMEEQSQKQSHLATKPARSTVFPIVGKISRFKAKADIANKQKAAPNSPK